VIQFQLSTSRLMVGRVRRTIRDIAFDHDVDVDFDEERGWLFCELYGSLRGDRADCEEAMQEIEATVDAHNARRSA
jgi:hypothetical protein